MRFSLEWKIGLAITLLALLIDPSHAVWRIAILVLACVIFLDVARVSDWTKGRSETLSLTSGIVVQEARSGVRTGFAYLVVLVVIAAYGVVTWPPKPAPTLPLQVVSLPTSAVNPPATPNGILPPKAVVPSLPSPTEPPKPQPKPKPEAKPNPKPPSKAPREELYPIVFVSETHVARNADAHHITIDISFSNTTNTEANAHISVEGVITVNGSDAGILSPASRDVGLAPPPYHYQLSTDVPLTPEADALYMNGSAVITMNGQVSYPDRGSTTIYRFKGVTNPKLDHLDLIQSEWEHSP